MVIGLFCIFFDEERFCNNSNFAATMHWWRHHESLLSSFKSLFLLPCSINSWLLLLLCFSNSYLFIRCWGTIMHLNSTIRQSNWEKSRSCWGERAVDIFLWMLLSRSPFLIASLGIRQMGWIELRQSLVTWLWSMGISWSFQFLNSEYRNVQNLAEMSSLIKEESSLLAKQIRIEVSNSTGYFLFNWIYVLIYE